MHGQPNQNLFSPDTNYSLAKSKSILLHERALLISQTYRSLEAELLKVLIEVERSKIYLEFELTSLHQYCVELLGLSRSVANDFINVTRTSFKVPELAEAVYSGKTTISKARKICSVVTSQNQKEWIDLVIHCSARVVEKAVAQANPRSAVPESLKYVSGNILQLTLAVSEEWAELLSKSKDRLSQKMKRSVSTEEALFMLMSEAHEKDDPVKKAERAQIRLEKKVGRKTEDPSRLSRSGQLPQGAKASDVVTDLDDLILKTERKFKVSHLKRSRVIPASVQHAVNLRDQGQCAHIYPSGNRCENRRWVDLHHIVPFAYGGEQAAENLETLCSAHHRMRHLH